MMNRQGWIALSVLMVLVFGVYAMDYALTHGEQSVSTTESVIDDGEQSVSTTESVIDDEPYIITVDPEIYEAEDYVVNDLSRVEILTDEFGDEYYIDESDGQGDRMYLDPIKADGRTPEQIAKDLFFEGKRVEYERRLDRSISDMEFEVMYEQEYREQQQRMATARASGPLTGPALASRKLFCGDDALCMQTGIQ